jgi:hypothetical protein
MTMKVLLAKLGMTEYDLVGLIKCPVILLVTMRLARFQIGDVGGSVPES